MTTSGRNYPNIKRLINNGTIEEYSIESPQVSEILDCVLAAVPEESLDRIHGFGIHEQHLPYDALYLVDGKVMIDGEFFEKLIPPVQIAVIVRTLALLVLHLDVGARHIGDLRQADGIGRGWGFHRELAYLGTVFGEDIWDIEPVRRLRRILGRGL